MGCSTPYQPLNSFDLRGGYIEKEISPGIWRVMYSGNGYTTMETAQTYFLYRCAELTLSKNYEGFSIVSNVNLARIIKNDAKPVKVASVAPHYVYVPGSSDSQKGYMVGDIQLLHQPLALEPGRVFDAAKLKAVLDPIVNGKKCDAGNVCPHVHSYIYPEGRILKGAG